MVQADTRAREKQPENASLLSQVWHTHAYARVTHDRLRSEFVPASTAVQRGRLPWARFSNAWKPSNVVEGNAVERPYVGRRGR